MALSYQWYKDGVAIQGANSATYSKASAAVSDEGSYYCKVSNDYGSVNSNPATVTLDNTLLLVQVDLVDDVPTIVERTGNGTITTSGTVIVDATTTEDGYGSIRNTATTSSTTQSGFLTIASSTILTGSWCIEGHLRRLTDSWAYPQAWLSAAGFCIGESGSANPYVGFSCNGTEFAAVTFVEASGWNHVAMSYDGIALRAFMDGVLVGSREDSITSVDVQNLLLGYGGPCMLENVRVSNIARYTENFTPPGRF